MTVMKRFYYIILSLMALFSAQAQDRLYIADFAINAGETKQVEIMLDNAVAYTALQADIYLPEGLTIEQEDGEYLFDLTDRKARNHTISSSGLASGAVRILIASQTLKEISGNSGALVTFNIIADASFSGTKAIELKGVVATEADRTEHQLPDTQCTVTGPQGSDEPPVVGDDRLYIADFAINAGETKQVEIMLDNTVAYTALQADIYLPEGLTIEQEDGEYLFDLTDRKARNHTISSSGLASGAVRILIASQTLKEISGNSGALVTFNIIADASFSGTKAIELKSVVATEADRTEHLLPDTQCTVTNQGGEEPPVVGDDRLYIADFAINAGETKQVEIMLDNTVAYTALQADIYLPEGLTIEQEDGEYLFDLTDRKGRNHTLSSANLASGAVRILIVSQTLKEISGNSGAVVTFNVIADASFSGTKAIELKGVVATEADRTEHLLPDTQCTVTAQGVMLSTTMARLQLQHTLQLSNKTGTQVSWTSSDPTVATVDENGMVTALKNGMVAITATDAQGNSAWCAIWCYLRGDVNEDDKVDVTDVNIDVNIILGKE